MLGVTFGAWSGRLPDVKASVDASPAQLGLAFAVWSGAALISVPFAGGVVERAGSRRVFAFAGLLYLAAFVALGLAASVFALAAAFAAYGVAGSFVDTAINAQGAHVERAYGRPIFSGLHALFSVGVLAGAGASAAAVAAGIAVAPYLALVGALCAAAGVPIAYGFLREERHERPPVFAFPTRALAVPAALAFAALLAEDVANTWTAVYARDVGGASPRTAALVLAVFAGAMVVSRVAADGLVARATASRVVSVSAAVCAGGFALAAAAPNIAVVTVAFALVGAGIGPVFPLALLAASRAGVRGAAPAMAAASTVGSLGSLLGPSSVGAIGSAAGLRAALAAVAVVVALAGVVALRLRA